MIGEPRVKSEILVANRNDLWAISPSKQKGKGLKVIWTKRVERVVDWRPSG
jgi:hypothetical protein